MVSTLPNVGGGNFLGVIFAQKLPPENYPLKITPEKLPPSSDTCTQDEVFKSNPGTGIIEERAPSNTTECDETSAGTTKVARNSKYTSKRIACELCEKKFNKSDTFKKHMKNIHKETPSVEGPADNLSKKIVNKNQNPPIFNLMTRMTLRSIGLPTKENSNAPESHIDKE